MLHRVDHLLDSASPCQTSRVTDPEGTALVRRRVRDLRHFLRVVADHRDVTLPERLGHLRRRGQDVARSVIGEPAQQSSRRRDHWSNRLRDVLLLEDLSGEVLVRVVDHLTATQPEHGNQRDQLRVVEVVDRRPHPPRLRRDPRKGPGQPAHPTAGFRNRDHPYRVDLTLSATVGQHRHVVSVPGEGDAHLSVDARVVPLVHRRDVHDPILQVHYPIPRAQAADCSDVSPSPLTPAAAHRCRAAAVTSAAVTQRSPASSTAQ